MNIIMTKLMKLNWRSTNIRSSDISECSDRESDENCEVRRNNLDGRMMEHS